MSQKYSKEKEIGIEAVMQASELARKMQGSLDALDVVNKEDLSPVTITDFSCQALINFHLMNAFPYDEIMGEEDTLFLRDPQNQLIKNKVIELLQEIYPSLHEEEILAAIDKGGSNGGAKGRIWVLDPIDGTRGFIRQENYAIALALIEDGEVVLGILGCPRLSLKGYANGGMFIAVKGGGCSLLCYDTLEIVPVAVDPEREVGEMIYCEPHSSSQHHSHSDALNIAKEMKANPKPFRLDSQCKYAMVAHGDAAIYLRLPTKKPYIEKIWDHAAGMIVVEEAGGRVTDAFGKRLDFSLGQTLADNFGIVATNGYLHEKALEAARKVLKSAQKPQ